MIRRNGVYGENCFNDANKTKSKKMPGNDISDRQIENVTSSMTTVIYTHEFCSISNRRNRNNKLYDGW